MLTITYSVMHDGLLVLSFAWLLDMFQRIPAHFVYFDISQLVLGVNEAAQLSAAAAVGLVKDFVSVCSDCSNRTACPQCGRFSTLLYVCNEFNSDRLALVVNEGNGQLHAKLMNDISPL